jgi:ribosomal protein S17E
MCHNEEETIHSEQTIGIKRRRSQDRKSSPEKDKMIKAISNHLLTNFEKNFQWDRNENKLRITKVSKRVFDYIEEEQEELQDSEPNKGEIQEFHEVVSRSASIESLISEKKTSPQ